MLADDEFVINLKYYCKLLSPLVFLKYSVEAETSIRAQYVLYFNL